MGKEKFPGETVESLKAKARIEETFPDADACPRCAAKRSETADPTWLCDDHLARIYGVGGAGAPKKPRR
jgi:hypothetical protein